MTRIFIIVILLAAAVLIFTMWTRPLWDEIQNLRGEKNAAQAAVEHLYSLRQIRDSLLSDYNTISRDDLKRLNSFLPASAERGNLLIEFENIAKAHNVILRRVDIAVAEPAGAQSRPNAAGQAKTKGAAEETPFTLTVSASYDSFIAFLSDLEKSLRLIDIDEISFSAAEKGTYDFSLKAHTYWLK